MLGPKSRDVELVAIVANPLYHEIAYTRPFDSQERLAHVPNWLYLTGWLAQLQQARVRRWIATCRPRGPCRPRSRRAGLPPTLPGPVWSGLW